ncbi:MAG: hypothetical protein IKC14_03535 [Kiritimatiellae bacterium]|nr:hypothetical protein [Kiritimatiellia bacterium]
MNNRDKSALALALAIVGGIAAGLRCDASAQGNAAAEAALGRTLEQFRNPQVWAEFEPYAQLSKSAFKNIAPFIVSMVKARLNRANVRGFNLDVSAVAQLMKSSYRAVLNERTWPVVSKTFSTSVGNRPVEMTSTIVPAEQLGRSEENPRGLIASRYPQGVHGYTCHSADARNAVNLAVTQLTVSVAGFMSGSVKSIKERLGGKAYHTFHRGGANNIA